MFSVAENIYIGWQYLITLLSPVGENINLIYDIIPSFSNYIERLFQAFTVPDFLKFFIVTVLSLGLLFKVCHWG